MHGITVVVPVHGRSPFLLNAIESIQAQRTSESLEIIYVLDRASKESEELIRTFSNKHSRVITSNQAGISAAHNLGVWNANFDLIAIMHSDDEMLPYRLEKQAKFLRENEQIVCVGGQIEFVDERGQFKGFATFPTLPNQVRWAMKKFCVIAHPTAMYRREIAVKALGYQEEFVPAEDFHLWTKMLRFGEIANLPDLVLRYRLHPEQLSQKRKEESASAKLSVILSMQRKDGIALSKWGSQLHKYREVLFERILQSTLKGRTGKKPLLVLFQFAVSFLVSPSSGMAFVRLWAMKRQIRMSLNRSLERIEVNNK
jgi:glycosyltransferase involved in cell wall biosynthesis